ncbi:potassium channel family protein [Gracilimonas mengyeensis]|uniref:Trk system potassium uptake protein TrkA n=1 Tax=Gracilimonas mengyeensis TaxID=1302730 RepID=A0A521ES76_9BACT|nr:TrkA family potassium uptake protein [Gracilimonas mengyeensis]SMO86747.1 trk system potassium uptake protein TrkA [Gracilimonas mengyeensis]
MATNNQQFCVIGLGEFGFSLAKSLAENGAYVLAIDNDYDRIEEIKKYVAQAVQFDATDPALLKEHGVCDVDVVIVAIGESFEPVVLITMELLKQKVGRVISRASSDTQETILNKIGISEVIHPEKDEGIRMATALLSTSITDFFQLSDDVGIFEIDAPKGMVGYSLKELKIRERYNMSLITIKRKRQKEESNGIYRDEEDSYFEVMGVLDPHTMIRKTDRLIIMGSQASLEKLMDTN